MKRTDIIEKLTMSLCTENGWDYAKNNADSDEARRQVEWFLYQSSLLGIIYNIEE